MSARGGAARRALAALALSLVVACAGGLPSIPSAPDDILRKGDAYFERGKYFQAQELYRAFVERFPGHDGSDRAQFRLAESLFRDGQYELAAVEYRVVTSRYGYSEYVDDALFRIGECYWKQAPRAARDQQKARDAMEIFRQYIETFPNGEFVQAARDSIRAIRERLAEKAMIAVTWYYRRHRYRAARIYCDKIIREYPDNRFWARALYYRGLIALQRGHREAAAEDFARVVAWKGDDPVKARAQEKLRALRP